MSKKIFLILACILLLGCNNGKESKVENAEVSEVTQNEVTNTKRDNKKEYKGYPTGDIVESKELYNENGIKLELIKGEYDEDSVNICIDLENNYGNRLSVETLKINFDGVDTSQFLFSLVPNEGKSRFFYEIPFDFMESMGKKNVSEIELKYLITDYETDANFYIDDIVIKTNLPFEEMDLVSESFSILSDESIELRGFDFIEEDEENIYFEIYLENKMDYGVQVMVEDLLINGYAVENYFNGYLPENTKGFNSIFLDFLALKHIGVDSKDDIKTMRFSISAVEVLNYEEIYKSGKITIDF